MPKFKKGSKEAKAFMAKLRAKRAKVSGAKKTVKPAAKKVAQKAPKKLARKVATKRHTDTKSHNVNIRVGSIKSEINFGVYCKGKRVLLTKSPTTAINEAKFYSSALNCPAYIKSGKSVFGKYVNGKLVK